MAISLICMSLCYIILRNRAKRHLANRPLNWYASVTSLNKRSTLQLKNHPCCLSVVRHGGSSDLNYVDRGTLCYTVPIVDRGWWSKISLKLSTAALKEGKRRSHPVQVCSFEVPVTARINTEYRRQRWLGDSKEAHQVVLI